MNYKALNNLATMFFDSAEQFPKKPFLWAKRNGKYISGSYSETKNKVQLLADSLHQLGVEKGDRVVVVSENRPEWVIADLAIISLGGITV
ncbi:MAG: long-chain fatty acid--CoA ligase, partial [Rhodospirillaceae bacterium]